MNDAEAINENREDVESMSIDEGMDDSEAMEVTEEIAGVELIDEIIIEELMVQIIIKLIIQLYIKLLLPRLNKPDLAKLLNKLAYSWNN